MKFYLSLLIFVALLSLSGCSNKSVSVSSLSNDKRVSVALIDYKSFSNTEVVAGVTGGVIAGVSGGNPVVILGAAAGVAGIYQWYHYNNESLEIEKLLSDRDSEIYKELLVIESAIKESGRFTYVLVDDLNILEHYNKSMTKQSKLKDFMNRNRLDYILTVTIGKYIQSGKNGIEISWRMFDKEMNEVAYIETNEKSKDSTADFTRLLVKSTQVFLSEL